MTKNIEEKLTELFIKWKERQEGNPDEYNWEKTGIAVSSFTKDGIVNENTWNKLEKQGKERVLYLLREANGNSSESGQMGREVDDGEFWFKKCVEENHIGNRIFKRIVAMQRLIQEQEELSEEEALRQVAYMNINKRGGGAKVDWKVLNLYASTYAEEIKKEICLIKPTLIVCCGTYWPLVDNICDLYKPKRDEGEWESGDDKDYYLENVEIQSNIYGKCTVDIINMYHPSAIMSDEKYIKRFRSIYKRSLIEEQDNCLLMDIRQMIQIVIDIDEKSEQYLELCEFLRTIENEKKNGDL